MKYTNVLQLKISLKYSKPNIYRVIYFPADANFMQLHTAIQIALGWTSSHLYQFIKNRVFICKIPL